MSKPTTKTADTRPTWAVRGLPEDLVLRLSAVSFALNRSQADLVTAALQPYLAKLERQHGLAGAVRRLTAARRAASGTGRRAT